MINFFKSNIDKGSSDRFTYSEYFSNLKLRNPAVEVITKDNDYIEYNTPYPTHKYIAQSIYQKLYSDFESFDAINPEVFWATLALEYNNVVIELNSPIGGLTIVFLPPTLNEYQTAKLREFSKAVKSSKYPISLLVSDRQTNELGSDLDIVLDSIQKERSIYR